MSDDFFRTSNLNRPTEQSEGWRNAANQFVTAGHSTPRDQWLRKISLVVGSGDTSQASTPGIALSQLRISFRVTKNTNLTPNLLYARVYNLSPQTMAKVIEFKRVQLSAGYQQGNFGTIFDGTVYQWIKGKENAVDTYLDIYGGDGDRALNNSVLIQSFPAGTTDGDKLRAAIKSLQEFDVSPGYISSELDNTKSLKHSTEVKESRGTIRELMMKHNHDFWIENGKANVVSRKKVLGGDIVVLAPNSGLIGMPQVTAQGIQAQCLMNTKLRLGGVVNIKSSNLSGVPYMPGTHLTTDAQGNLQGPSGIPNEGRFPAATFGQQLTSAFTSPVGLYKILLLEYIGDTRGTPWYDSIVCIALDESGNVMPTGVPSEAFLRAHAEAF